MKIKGFAKIMQLYTKRTHNHKKIRKKVIFTSKLFILGLQNNDKIVFVKFLKFFSEETQVAKAD